MRPACGFANCRSRRNAFWRDCAAKQAAAAPMPLAGAAAAGCDRPMAKSVCRRGAASSRPPRRCASPWLASAPAVLPWRAIAPIARPDASTWSAATIARGQQLAALGDCAVCHTVVERRRQCRRPADRDAVRHHLRDQHHARCRDRDRRVVLSRLRARDARGHPSRRPASLSGVSLYRISPRPAMPTCRRSMPI